MDSYIFLYDPNLTPHRLGIENTHITTTAHLYDTKLEFVSSVCTELDESNILPTSNGIPTLKSTKKNLIVEGVLYKMGPTTFRAYERALRIVNKQYLRTFLKVFDGQNDHETRCIAYIPDFPQEVPMLPSRELVNRFYKMYGALKFSTKPVDIAIQQAFNRFYNLRQQSKKVELKSF